MCVLAACKCVKEVGHVCIYTVCIITLKVSMKLQVALIFSSVLCRISEQNVFYTSRTVSSV